jgi:iron(III) transport system substrate-binding protein
MSEITGATMSVDQPSTRKLQRAIGAGRKRAGRCFAVCAGMLVLLCAQVGQVGAQPATVAAIANYTGADRQKMLEDGARKEGELLLYTTGTQTAPLMNRFAQKYPFMRLKLYRAGGSEVAQKVGIEYQASFFAVDAFELGSDSLIVPRAQGILQPFTSPEMTAYAAESIDPQRMWVSARESYGGLSYNTRLVPAADAPKTWPDLLKPQYKGKMALPATPTTAAEWLGILLTTYGEDFVRKLGRQDIRIYRMAARALQNLVVSGEVPIAARASNAHVAEDLKKNATVAWVAPGPVAVTSVVVALAARPPHPHAAMLMIDFLISEEGQTMYKQIGYNSARKGLEDRDTPREKVYFTQRPTFVADFETWGELFREVFVNKR